MTFDQQKREAIAAAKHLVEILSEVCDESPSTTKDERRYLNSAAASIQIARVHVLSILNLQDVFKWQQTTATPCECWGESIASSGTHGTPQLAG